MIPRVKKSTANGSTKPDTGKTAANPKRKSVGQKKKSSFQLNNILFPTDFTPQNQALLPLVLSFCKEMHASLVIFHAYKIAIVDEYMPASMVDSMLLEGEANSISRMQTMMEGVETDVEVSYQAKMGFTAESISDICQEMGIDMIVMGTNGCNSLEDTIFGTVSWNTIKNAGVPVLTIPDGVKGLPLQNIIFPFECTDKDLDIIQFALQLTAAFNGKIHLIHFLLDGAVINKTILAKIHTRFHKEIRDERLVIQILSDKNITDGIVKYAENIQADTIIMVTHQRGLMATLFHMSTTRKIVLYSSLPLLAFKAE